MTACATTLEALGLVAVWFLVAASFVAAFVAGADRLVDARARRRHRRRVDAAGDELAALRRLHTLYYPGVDETGETHAP